MCNYENLAKAGRIPKAAGVIANKLNIRILGTASEAGKIELVGHTRGEKKMLNKIIDTMEAARQKLQNSDVPNDGRQAGDLLLRLAVFMGEGTCAKTDPT